MVQVTFGMKGNVTAVFCVFSSVANQSSFLRQLETEETAIAIAHQPRDRICPFALVIIGSHTTINIIQSGFVCQQWLLLPGFLWPFACLLCAPIFLAVVQAKPEKAKQPCST
jgi:hypothetical protein